MTGRSLPFQPLGQAQRTSLTSDRLKASQQVLNVTSGVAYFDGPAGHLLLFKGGEGFRFFVKGRFEMGVAGGTPAGPIDVNVGAAGHSIIQTPRPAMAFPTAYHHDVIAYTSADGGATWQRAVVNAVNYATGVVNVERPGNATRVAVYFVTGDGEFELRIVRPLGSDVSSAKLFGGAFRSIHETNQVNARSAPVFGATGSEYPLPPQFRLELAVRSKTPVVFDGYAEHELSLPVYDTPIRVLDAAAFNAQAEMKLRGGNL